MNLRGTLVFFGTDLYSFFLVLLRKSLRKHCEDVGIVSFCNLPPCLSFPSSHFPLSTGGRHQNQLVCMAPKALILWSEDVESVFREKLLDLWRPFSAYVHKLFLPIGWDHSLVICSFGSWLLLGGGKQLDDLSFIIRELVLEIMWFKQIIQSSVSSFDMVSAFTHLGLRIPQPYSSYTGCHLHSWKMCALKFLQALINKIN